MEIHNPSTPDTLHRIAAKMRIQADETRMPDYRAMMNRVAVALEEEAHRLAMANLEQAFQKDH